MSNRRTRLAIELGAALALACSSATPRDADSQQPGAAMSGRGGSDGPRAGAGPQDEPDPTDVVPVDWSWRIESRRDYLALERYEGEMATGFPFVQLYVRAEAAEAGYPEPFDAQPCLFGSARFGLHARFLDDAFPEQAARIIRAGFSQPNTLWFGFVTCEGEACEVILELSLLGGGTSVPPPDDAQIDTVRQYLGECAPYVAERMPEFTFWEVPPLGGSP